MIMDDDDLRDEADFWVSVYRWRVLGPMIVGLIAVIVGAVVWWA